MRRLGRYELSSLTVRRAGAALRTRTLEVPHWIAWQFGASAKANQARIREFAGIHRGRRCFVLANGPSLSRVNLQRLERETTFGLNRLYLLFADTQFRPTYYVAMNELVLEQFSSDIRNLRMPKFLNWNRRSLFSDDGSRTAFLKSRMVLRDSFQADLCRPVVVGATVTFVALQIAFYMGFEEVILLGLDHDYVEKGIPSETRTRPQSEDRSHFHPAYFPPGIRWQLPDLLRSEIDFQLARTAYEAAGRRILDATEGGRCPVFERVDLDQVLG